MNPKTVSYSGNNLGFGDRQTVKSLRIRFGFGNCDNTGWAVWKRGLSLVWSHL